MIWIGGTPSIANVTPLVEGHKVFTFDYLSTAQAGQMVSIIERSDRWHRSHVTSDSPHTVRRAPLLRNQTQISVYLNSTRDQLVFAEWFKCLRDPIASMLGIDPSPLVWSEVAQYQRSQNGDYFNWHRDPSAKFPLKAIALCYLSDADSHELVGGTTDFMLDSVVHSVTPKRGRVATFDPNILHRGAAVTHGMKYAFTFGWV